MKSQVRTTHDREHEQFVSSGAMSDSVRPAVANSWIRSAAAGVDPNAHLAPVVLDRSAIADRRASHPLHPVFPLLYDVLGRVAEACDYLMAVGDAAGNLLWVCGPPDVLRRAEAINFVEGAAWDEARAGTNAPGMALALDHAVQVHTAEHFNRLVQPWSCAAAPIHDLATHEVIGVVDVTGGEDVASPQTLGLVRAAARMAEAELARIALARGPLWTPREQRAAAVEIQALGRPDCLVRSGQAGESGAPHTRRLSPRHSDILVALVDASDGLTAEQLELEVYAGDVHSSTMRAEITRLRTLLGGDVLRSRPYRITGEIRADWREVFAHLAARRVDDALRAYAGPLLPHSEAPAVARLRDRLERELPLGGADVGPQRSDGELDAFAVGADDLEVWRQQAALLPMHSPLRPTALAEAARLERELGA